MDSELCIQFEDVDGGSSCYRSGFVCLRLAFKEQASKETVHDRYKDLSHVEWAFRTSKTTFLDARPIYVCLESRTRGHLLVVMLAYLLVQELATCCRDLDLTVEEGLAELKSLCTTQVTVKGRSVLHNIPKPRPSGQRLLDAAGVTLPHSLVDRGVPKAGQNARRERVTAEKVSGTNGTVVWPSRS